MSRRAVVVAGVRTPFLKAFTQYTSLDTIALGVAAVRGLLETVPLNPVEIDALVWGGVVLPPGAPNVAREVVLDLRWPASIEARTVTRACASGLQAVTDAAQAIEHGDADVVIAGGSDSTSNAAITLPPRFIQQMGPVVMGKKGSPWDLLRAAGGLRLKRDVIPSMPKVAERSTGEVMGEAAERMASRNGISREAQDGFALRSHQRAAAAVTAGRFDRELTKVSLPNGGEVLADGLIRGTTNAEQLGRLRPAFQRGGTVTAGNSSPLTDGAAAVLLMAEEKARALGLHPLAAVRQWSYVGVDPADQLLIGPAIAMPKVLQRAGLTMRDIDLVDMHEAFAAQVLSVVKALESKAFAEQRLGLSTAVGMVSDAQFNIHGGSLAIGHPFAATGARMVTTMAHELAQSQKQFALLGLCAAGGLGAAALLEAVS